LQEAQRNYESRELTFNHVAIIRCDSNVAIIRCDSTFFAKVEVILKYGVLLWRQHKKP